MRLLGSVSLGRIVFTARALPAIRPVCHLVDGDYVIIRTDSSAAITSELRARRAPLVPTQATRPTRPSPPAGASMTLARRPAGLALIDADSASRPSVPRSTATDD